MKPKKVTDEDGQVLECYLEEGRVYVYVYVKHDSSCAGKYLGAAFTAAEVPALRKWAKALLKMCDDKSLEVDA